MYWPITPLEIIEVLGTLAFASSGATRAIRKRYDVFGLLVLAFVTSIGGGTLRDILIGDLPVAWLNDFTLITTVIVATAFTYFFNSFMDKLRWWVFIFDAIGLGLFTLLGVEKGLELGFSPFVCILLGVLSASFGGVIRDLLSGEIPLLLRKEIYASASILGAALFLIMDLFSAPLTINYVVSGSAAVALRVLSYRYGWSLQLPLKDRS